MKKLIAPLALCALIIAACQTKLNTTVYTDDYVLPLSDLRQDTLTVKISAEYPLGDDEVTVKLRKTISELLFSYGWDTDESCFDSVAVAYRNSIVDDYLYEYSHSAEDTTDTSIMSWELDMTGYFLPDWDKYYRYREDFYEYKGGAHGISGTVCFVFDMKDGSLVEEQEFFKDGYEEPVSALIRQHLVTDYVPQLQEGFEAEDFVTSPASVNGVYLPGPKGVKWFYQPYEIAPYAFGIIAVEVPWDELKPWVR